MKTWLGIGIAVLLMFIGIALVAYVNKLPEIRCIEQKQQWVLVNQDKAPIDKNAYCEIRK